MLPGDKPNLLQPGPIVPLQCTSDVGKLTYKPPFGFLFRLFTGLSHKAHWTVCRWLQTKILLSGLVLITIFMTVTLDNWNCIDQLNVIKINWWVRLSFNTYKPRRLPQPVYYSGIRNRPQLTPDLTKQTKTRTLGRSTGCPKKVSHVWIGITQEILNLPEK